MEAETETGAPAYVPRTDPASRPTARPDAIVPVGVPGNPAIAEWALAGCPEPDMEVIRGYRLGRIKQRLADRDVAGCLLYDPLNIRYATDTSNMQVWCLQNPVRYCSIATEGPVVLFDFHGSGHLSADLWRVDETRTGTLWFYFGAGPEEESRAGIWAAEIADLVYAHGGGNRRLLIDKCDDPGIRALRGLGVECIAGQEFTEAARGIKHPEELKAMRRAIHVSETGMLRDVARAGTRDHRKPALVDPAPGQHRARRRMDRDAPARLGPAHQPVVPGMLGPDHRSGRHRRFRHRPDRPLRLLLRHLAELGNAGKGTEQRAGFAASNGGRTDRLQYRADAAGPDVPRTHGAPFRSATTIFPHRYSAILHGVGLYDEYPSIAYPGDAKKGGYDGVFQAGMVVCLASFVGATGGGEGAKFERQAVITETGVQLLDTFPTGLVPDLQRVSRDQGLLRWQ